MAPFNPYHNWLGIPSHEQPPNFYRLLGLVLFESNPAVIAQAADRRSVHVGSFQNGPGGEYCQRLMIEIAQAVSCLLDPQQKAAYDNLLQESLAARTERSTKAARAAVGAFVQNGNAPFRQNPTEPFGQQPMSSFMQGPPVPMQPRAAVHPQSPIPAPFPTAARPIPVANRVTNSAMRPVTANGATTTLPPPQPPPAAPPRPVDELENLATTRVRRRFGTKKRNQLSMEVAIGVAVAAIGALCFVVWWAATNGGAEKSGIGKLGEPTPTTTTGAEAAAQDLTKAVAAKNSGMKSIGSSTAADDKKSHSITTTAPKRPKPKLAETPSTDGNRQVATPNSPTSPPRPGDENNRGAVLPEVHATGPPGSDDDPVMEDVIGGQIKK